MRSSLRWTVLLATLALVVGAALPAAADHATRPHTPNIHALGHSPQPGSFLVPDGQRTVNSDIACKENPRLVKPRRRVGG